MQTLTPNPTRHLETMGYICPVKNIGKENTCCRWLLCQFKDRFECKMWLLKHQQINIDIVGIYKVNQEVNWK